MGVGMNMGMEIARRLLYSHSTVAAFNLFLKCVPNELK